MSRCCRDCIYKRTLLIRNKDTEEISESSCCVSFEYIDGGNDNTVVSLEGIEDECCECFIHKDSCKYCKRDPKTCHKDKCETAYKYYLYNSSKEV